MREFKAKIKQDFISTGIRLRNKYPPISERVNEKLMVQKIKRIYQLREYFNNFYLIITKSSEKDKDTKYHLGIILATQSSDLLAKIAKKLISDQDKTRLIQFPFHPEHFRVSLAFLREIEESTNVNEVRSRLIFLRNQFLAKLNNIID